MSGDMFRRLWARLKRRNDRNPLSGVLSVSGDGVVLRIEGQEKWRFHWADITRVETYKIDLFTFDTICLSFVDELRQLEYKTFEEMAGFSDFIAELDRHFPGIDNNWYTTVMLPAFSTNYRVLWPDRPQYDNQKT